MRILRQRAISEITGRKPASIYRAIAAGLFPPSVDIGPRQKGWPAHEIEAINMAMVAGKSDEELRELVKRMVSDRASLDPMAYLDISNSIERDNAFLDSIGRVAL